MAAYVIKSWRAYPVPVDTSGVYVHIVGRAQGVISWVLSQLAVDPIVALTVLESKVLFEKGSLAGSDRRVIPMSKVSSSYYGYSKPWKEAILIAILGTLVAGFVLAGTVSERAAWMAIPCGAVVGIVFYALNKTLTIGIVEDSGVESSFQFKKSVIEGQSIDEAQARMVCDIIEARLSRQQLQLPHLQAIQQLAQGQPLWSPRSDA